MCFARWSISAAEIECHAAVTFVVQRVRFRMIARHALVNFGKGRRLVRRERYALRTEGDGGLCRSFGTHVSGMLHARGVRNVTNSV